MFYHNIEFRRWAIPLDRLILILVVVIAAAALTVWGGAGLLAGFAVNPMISIGILSIRALGAYLVFRVVSERLNNLDEDHYDNMEN